LLASATGGKIHNIIVIGTFSDTWFAGVTREKIIRWLPKGCSYTLEGHTDGVLSLGHVNEFNKLLSGSADRTVRVWDISEHEPQFDGELKGHRSVQTLNPKP
jgi:WD40 repeat protein